MREDTIMKRILIVNGSNRRKGNSYTLESRIAGELSGKAEVVTFNIGEKDVRACLACDTCKRQHTPNCIQMDDFTALIPEIDSCDAMLILAPVHWDQFPAQLKARSNVREFPIQHEEDFEAKSAVTAASSVADCTVWEISGNTYIAVLVQGCGLSVFQLQ